MISFESMKIRPDLPVTVSVPMTPGLFQPLKKPQSYHGSQIPLKELNMLPRFILATILLALLLASGFATAAIPTPLEGRITDSVTRAVADMINIPDITAVGVWNNQI